MAAKPCHRPSAAASLFLSTRLAVDEAMAWSRRAASGRRDSLWPPRSPPLPNSAGRIERQGQAPSRLPLLYAHPPLSSSFPPSFHLLRSLARSLVSPVLTLTLSSQTRTRTLLQHLPASPATSPYSPPHHPSYTMLVPAGFLSTLLLTASVASAAGHGPSSAKRANSHKDKAAALRRAGTAAHERSLPDLAPGHHAVAKKRGEKRCKVRNAPVSAAMAPNSSVQPVDSMPKSSAAAAEPSPSPSSSAWQEPAPTPTSVVLNLAIQPTPTTKWVAPTTSSKAEWVAYVPIFFAPCWPASL